MGVWKGLYRGRVVWVHNGFKHFGGKDLLYMIDGLYPAEECEINVIRFDSFDNHWTASIFMSAQVKKAAATPTSAAGAQV